MNLYLLEWMFSARTRSIVKTQSAHTTGVNSDLADGEALPSAVCHKSYPNMEQIEERIEEFRKWYRSTSLRQRGTLFQFDQVSYVQMKITVFRTECCFRRAGENSRSKSNTQVGKTR